MSASPSIWLLSRLGYADFSAVLSSRDTSIESIEPDGQSVYVVTRHEFHASLTGVKFAVGGGLEVIPGVIVGVAPTVTVVMGKEQNQIERIISPQDTPFLETGTETRPVAGGTPIVFKPVQFGADLMIEANIPLGRRLALRPEVRGSIFLGSVVNNANWSRSGLSGLIGLSYDFSHHPDSIPLPVARPVQPPDTVRLAESAPKPYLAAKIKVYGIDQAGQRYSDPVIEIEQAPWVEGVPIIPYIFFDSGASRIADRYVQIRNPEVRAHFAIDSLVAITPLDMHWQSLNVIGERLRANPGVTLTVNGTASSDEADAQRLGEQRARSVAQYLTETWKIAPERITVTSPPRSIGGTPEESQEGRQENRRAELILSDDIILKPVIIHRLATIASPPAVRFSPEIIADTTVAEWYITVEQGGKELLHFNGGSSEAALRQPTQWSLVDMRVNHDLTPVRYRLYVRDVLGQEATDEGTFKVAERTVVKEDGLRKSREVMQYNIVGFKYNSADLSPAHIAQLQDVASAIGGHAEVQVVGYTDRVGDPERNRQLSLTRAKAVQDAVNQARIRLGLSPITWVSVLGLGNEKEVYSNDLPEGRLLSRMVRILVVGAPVK